VKITTDQWNALNEMGAAFFAFLNVRALYRAKRVEGVHWAAWGFYSYWGIANLVVYPANGMVVSFYGGIPVVIFNLIWLALVWRYRKPINNENRNGCGKGAYW
jgi:hypothetical protein